MTENVSSRYRRVTVRGWEPLGNYCKGTSCTKRAEPYKSLESGNQGQFDGSWGYHYFTLNQLQKRSKAYWCTWSDDWASFDYVKFRGMKVTIPADQFHTWMISFDAFLITKEGLPLQERSNNEDQWIHPGILMNNPKTHLILPQNYHQRKRFYKIWVKPPTGWKGYERFPDAMNYILCHWFWTVFSLNQPFFDVCNCNNRGQDQCVANPWWVANGEYDKWINRTKYDTCQSGAVNKTKTWGPFLESQNCSGSAFSAYFLYKAYFTFRGESIWRPLPHVFANEGLVPEAPGPSAGTRENYKKRPADCFDILPGDLDSDGILTEEAFQRITGADKRHKRRKVEDPRSTRHLSNKLRKIIRYFLLKHR